MTIQRRRRKKHSFEIETRLQQNEIRNRKLLSGTIHMSEPFFFSLSLSDLKCNNMFAQECQWKTQKVRMR